MNERIKEVRIKLGLTQQQFAERIGIKRTTIANYEVGRNTPVDSVITLICREFNVNEEWLRTGNGNMFLPDANDEIDALTRKYNLTGEMRVFIENFVQASEETQIALVKFIENTAAKLQQMKDKGELPNLSENQDKATIYNMYHTDSYVAETSPDEEYNTIEAAEAAYNKSRLNSVQKTTLSASNITTATGTDDK